MTKYEPISTYRWTVPANYTIREMTDQRGRPFVRIKGIAVRAGEISKNGRQYMKTALIRSVSSWMGKPLNVNHNDKMIVGDLNEMDYDENIDALVYSADVKKEPYMSMVRNKSKEITGVSIQAKYARNRCPDCGKEDFQSKEDFISHMGDKHFKRNILEVPWGILGEALSLVHGLLTGCNSTLELAESTGFGDFHSLCETAIKEEEKREMSGAAIRPPEKQIAVGKSSVITDDIDGILVSVTALPPEAQTVVTSPQIQDQVKAEPAKTTMKVLDKIEPVKIAETIPKLKLGEPFADYVNFEDCVSKNQDKDNPEGFCAYLKKQTEGETYKWEHVKHLTATVNEMINVYGNHETVFLAYFDDVKQKLGEINARFEALPKDDTTWKEPLQGLPSQIAEVNAKLEQKADVEAVKETAGTIDKLKETVQGKIDKVQTDLKQEVASLPKDDTSWKQVIENLPKDDLGWKEQLKEIPKDDLGWKELKIPDITPIQQKLEEIEKRDKDEFAAYKKDLLEFWKPKVDNLEKENADLKKKVQETEDKTVKETREKEDLTVRVDNLEESLGKGKFKGKAKAVTPEPKSGPNLTFNP